MFKMQPGARPKWGIAVPSSCASKVALGSWILEWNRSTSGSNPSSWPELGSVGQSMVPVTARAQLWSPRGPFPGELDSLWVLPPQSEIIHGFVSRRITSPPSWFQELGSPRDKTKPFQGMIIALKQTKIQNTLVFWKIGTHVFNCN